MTFIGLCVAVTYIYVIKYDRCSAVTIEREKTVYERSYPGTTDKYGNPFIVILFIILILIIEFELV